MPWCSSCRGSTNSGDKFGGRIRGRIRGARKFGERKIRGGHKIRGAKIKFGEPKSNSGSGNQIRGAETKFGEPKSNSGSQNSVALVVEALQVRKYRRGFVRGRGPHEPNGPGPGARPQTGPWARTAAAAEDTSPEHPGPILPTPRDIISCKGNPSIRSLMKP
jgi:hypothetical protein